MTALSYTTRSRLAAFGSLYRGNLSIFFLLNKKQSNKRITGRRRRYNSRWIPLKNPTSLASPWQLQSQPLANSEGVCASPSGVRIKSKFTASSSTWIRVDLVWKPGIDAVTARRFFAWELNYHKQQQRKILYELLSLIQKMRILLPSKLLISRSNQNSSQSNKRISKWSYRDHIYHE